MIMLFWNTHQELKKSSSKNTEGHYKFNQINILFLEKLKDFMCFDFAKIGQTKIVKLWQD